MRSEMVEGKYPDPMNQQYVRDRNGVIWRVVRDGGMVTCSDYSGIYSAGIEWLRENHGPLLKVPGKDDNGWWPEERVLNIEESITAVDYAVHLMLYAKSIIDTGEAMSGVVNEVSNLKTWHREYDWDKGTLPWEREEE